MAVKLWITLLVILFVGLGYLISNLRIILIPRKNDQIPPTIKPPKIDNSLQLYTLPKAFLRLAGTKPQPC